MNEFSLLKRDISILHRTLLLNCPLQSKGQGMEWVRGMEKEEWVKGMESALSTARATRLRLRRNRVVCVRGPYRTNGISVCSICSILACL